MRKICCLTTLLFYLFCVLTGVEAQTPQVKPSPSTIYLVAVGVSDYGCIGSLNLPANDAKAMADVFMKRKSEVILLTNAKATEKNIVAAMNQLFVKAQPNDIVMLFFSGHGFSEGFCTYDTNCSPGGYLDYDAMRDAFSKSNAKRKLIFADACYSGAFRTKPKKTKEQISQDLEKVQLLLFLSSRSNEVSYENAGMANGYFTHYIIRGLNGEADANKNSLITAKELFKYVHMNVAKSSLDRQHPVMWGHFADGLILMNLKKESVKH